VTHGGARTDPFRELDQSSASYRDGVLQPRIPVAERAKPRKISIEVTCHAQTIEGSSEQPAIPA
jgi:HSP20 family protein